MTVRMTATETVTKMHKSVTVIALGDWYITVRKEDLMMWSIIRCQDGMKDSKRKKYFRKFGEVWFSILILLK